MNDDDAYDGLDLRDVLCICAVLVAAGMQDDAAIQETCSAHAHGVLTVLAREATAP